LVQEHVLGDSQRCFYVAEGGDARGVITLDDLRRVSRGKREGLTAAAIMTPVESVVQADADEEVWSLLQRMASEEVNQISVMDQGRFLGLITREKLWNQIRLRNELAA
jgi:CBS domain-containing protein